MKTLEVSTFDDIAKVGSSKLRSLADGKVVRTLRVLDSQHVHMTAGDGTQILIERSTPLFYEPWIMDRGSICFRHPAYEPNLKLCTEMDWIETVDGEQYRIVPAENLLKNLAARATHSGGF